MCTSVRGSTTIEQSSLAHRADAGMPVRKPRFTYRTAQQAWGVAFVLPVLLLFLGLRLYPMLMAAQISFQRYDLLNRVRPMIVAVGKRQADAG